MDFIADTSVIISFLSGYEPTASLLIERCEQHRLCLPSIVLFELLVGVEQGTKRANDLDELRTIAPILPFDTPCAVRAAEVYRQLRRIGMDIGVPDCLIAGVALHHGLPVMTENTSHFSRVPGLIVWSGLSQS